MKSKPKKYYFDVYGCGYSFKPDTGILFECTAKSLKAANKMFKKFTLKIRDLK